MSRESNALALYSKVVMQHLQGNKPFHSEVKTVDDLSNWNNRLWS